MTNDRMFIHDLVGDGNLKNAHLWSNFLMGVLMIVAGILVFAVRKTWQKSKDLIRPLPLVIYPYL